MAAFFLARADDTRALAAARDQFARHGFPAGGEAEFDGWRLIHRPYRCGGPEMVLEQGDDLAAVAGTFVFDGLMGRPALEALLASDPPRLDWTRIGGHFAACVRKDGHTFLFADYFSAYQLFHDEHLTIFATTFLTAAKALRNPDFDKQGVYEFAFNVVPLGNDTIIAGLQTLSPHQLIELTEDDAIVHPLAKPLPDMDPREPAANRIARHRDRLHAIVAPHIRAFGDNVNCPLSGGLDSRLVLALLRAEGCTPNLYVYGDRDDEDVQIAQAIGAAEGFKVEWIDKDRPAPAPDAFADQVAHNFRQFDGIPTYGNIFDEGGYAEAQLRRHANGALAVSGGCGEIYRDFFFMPDRPASAEAVARTFFARFAPGDGTGLFDARTFIRKIAYKIAQAVDAPSPAGRMPRSRIEHIYPRIRCRALFGREISLESQFGPYLMPFLDHQVVAEAMTLPMRLKQAGRFEAILLNAIDPALARHMSAYGHDFCGEPSRAHRWEEFSSRHRPAWLRAKSYAVKRRMGPMGDEHGGLLEPEYLSRVIDLDFPAMRRFFNIEAINDTGLYRRIACLEYLARELGIG